MNILKMLALEHLFFFLTIINHEMMFGEMEKTEEKDCSRHRHEGMKFF